MGELSLASPNPQRGFGLARDSLSGFFGGPATNVGATRGRQKGPRDAGCTDVARGWGGGGSTDLYRRRGTSGDAGDGSSEQTQEAGEHGGSEEGRGIGCFQCTLGGYEGQGRRVRLGVGREGSEHLVWVVARRTPHRMPRTASASPLGEGEERRPRAIRWRPRAVRWGGAVRGRRAGQRGGPHSAGSFGRIRAGSSGSSG